MKASKFRAFLGSRVRTAEAAFLILAAVLAIALAAHAGAATPSDPTGDWWTPDHDGVVHFGPCGGAFCGTIVGVSDWRRDGTAATDIYGRSQCHLTIVQNLLPGDDGRRHGTVTDPTDGKSYNAIVWIGEDGALRLRGYVGLQLFGETKKWDRFTGKVAPDCHYTG